MTSLSASLERGGPNVDGLQAEHLERALYGAAREFLARPGKAFRARLIEACFRLVSRSDESVPSAALEAIELLHGGSLIVDDIQDDADVRRGAPALHRAIGAPRALNTGNWLYFVALSRLDELPLGDESARELTRAAHQCLRRCHEGQSLDLWLRAGEVRRAEFASLVHVVSLLKTGALTGFAARLGATLAHASTHQLALLTRFGQHVGVALQMLDDLGSFVCESRYHKALEDLRQQRMSWVWSWASEVLDEVRYKHFLRQLSREPEWGALRAGLAETTERLGRARVRALLAQAEHELRSAFTPGHALEAVHLELTRLEKSYG